jgi:hypothetical protein
MCILGKPQKYFGENQPYFCGLLKQKRGIFISNFSCAFAKHANGCLNFKIIMRFCQETAKNFLNENGIVICGFLQ